MAGSYLVVARIVSSQGNRGEVKAEVLTGYPDRFASTTDVFLGPEHRRYELERFRFQDRAVVLKLRGVETMEDAAKLRDALVEVPEEDAVKLPPNHYFWHQIVGLQAVTAEGAVLGKIDEILETGSNDVYVVHGPEGELLIPAIEQVVKAIDLNSGTMTVELMPELD